MTIYSGELDSEGAENRTVYDYQTGYGDRMATVAGEAATDVLHGGAMGRIFETETAKLGGEGQRAMLQGYGVDTSGMEFPEPREVPIGEARERIKSEGLEKHVKLPDGDTIKAPLLDIMVDRGKHRSAYEQALARGPQGFVASALDVGTSLAVHMLDPVNLAASLIPVVGEARWASLMASAGTSAISRAGVRAGIGAVQGGAFAAAFEPLEWYADTQEGRDHTAMDALRNVFFGAALFGGLHVVGGGGVDIKRGVRGEPLWPFGPGEPRDKAAAAAPSGESLRAGTDLAAPPPQAGKGREGEATRTGFTPPADDEFLFVAQEAHPFQRAVADLPPGDQENLMQIAIAQVVRGDPVRVEEVLAAAAQHDPRIAESMAIAHKEPAVTGEAEIHADVLAQLRAAGMGAAEAETNAAIVAARYATRAARLGQSDAFALYRGEGLSIRGPGGDIADEPEAGRMFAQRGGPPDFFAEREAMGQENLPGTERIGEGALAQRRADQALKPKVAQKPMDEGLFGDSAAQKTLFQSARQAPPFYSALARAVTGAKQDKASPEQWLGMLKNTPGVKHEEMDWLGLADWLKEQKGAVTKQQVADYVRANSVEVREVEHGGPSSKADQINAEIRQLSNWPQDPHAAKHPDDQPRLNELLHDWQVANLAKTLAEQYPLRHLNEINTAEDVAGARRFAPEWLRTTIRDVPDADVLEAVRQAKEHLPKPPEPKFASYQLPGGENYRELLLTLPEKDKIERVPVKVPDGWGDTGGGNIGVDVRGDTGADFRSSHWDEPNVLAHVRFNDRTIDGKKTLFIEEIQSDWHQQGRRRGYQDAEIINDLMAKLEPLQKEHAAVGEQVDAQNKAIQTLQDFKKDPRYESLPLAGKLKIEDALTELLTNDSGTFEKMAELRRAMREFEDAVTQERMKVPAAPFKTSWPELSLKRMIRYAAEHGYEQVAWTRGETQAARYDLSKQIDRISLHGAPDVQPILKAVDKNGREVISRHIENPERDLPDIVGKDIAEKLLAREPNAVTFLTRVAADKLQVTSREHDWLVRVGDGRQVEIGKGTEPTEDGAREYAERYLNRDADQINENRRRMATPVRVLSGLDLKVGGEGMLKFYDDMLPAAATKLVKKFGAKVGEGSVDRTGGGGAGEWTYRGPDLTHDDVREIARARKDLPVSIVRQLEDIAAADWGDRGFAGAMQDFGSYRAAEVVGGRLVDAPKPVPVHTLPLTAPLREAAVGEGFPLFQRGESGPRGRIMLAENKAIVDLFKSADASTFMHEMSHKWLDEHIRDAAGPNAGPGHKADLDVVLRWLGVDKAEDVGTAQHEQWARGFEQYLAEGTAPSARLAAAFERFKQWLAGIYRAIAGKDVAISDDVRGVMGRMLATDEEMAGRAGAESAASPSPPSPAGGGGGAGSEQAAVHVAPKPARGPAARPEETWSLFEFLAHRGGLKPDAELDAVFGGKNRFVPWFGPLIRERGMSLDHAREAAVEAGYFIDPAQHHGGVTESTVNELLEALGAQERGNRVYRVGSEPRTKEDVRANREALEREVHGALSEVGIDAQAESSARMARVVEIMDREGVHDAAEAYERAVMEEERNAVEQRGARVGPVPGWDVHADGGTAPGAGGEPAGAGLRGSGARPRERGQADRAQDAGAYRAIAEQRDPDAAARLDASKAAERAPEPGSIDSEPAAGPSPPSPARAGEGVQPQSKRTKAAVAEEAQAIAEFDAAVKAGYLTEAERLAVEDAIRTINDGEIDARMVAARGVACLTAAAAGGAGA